MISDTLKISRRSFVIGTAAVGGGLALGLHIPIGGRVVHAQDGSPEINAWVVIRPDDTVVIRIALRDGAGKPHRSRPAGGRGTGVRLGEGDHRVSNPWGERQAPAGVG